MGLGWNIREGCPEVTPEGERKDMCKWGMSSQSRTSFLSIMEGSGTWKPVG